MVEAKTAENPEEPTYDEAAAEAAFRAGYEEEAPATTQPTETAVVAEPEPKEPVAAEPAAPKTVQFTEEDYKLLRSAAEDAPELKKQLSKAFGTIGTLQEQITQLKGQKGRVRIDKVAFGKLTEMVPEIAEALLPVLEGADVDVSTAQPAAQAAPAAVDPAEIQTKIEADILKKQQATEIKRLNFLLPGWDKVVGARDSDNGFWKWFRTQDKDYQSYIENVVNADATVDCIKRYQASVKPKPQSPAQPAQREARNDRLRGAIPPRGAGAAPAPATQTLQDAFREGYRSGTG